MMGPSYRPASGGGGTDPALGGRVAALETTAADHESRIWAIESLPAPVLIDEDVEIPVVDGDLKSAVEAAHAYKGRMAPGRNVTVRLPAGETRLSAVTEFRGVDFPELSILGQDPVFLEGIDFSGEFTVVHVPSEDVQYGPRSYHVTVQTTQPVDVVPGDSLCLPGPGSWSLRNVGGDIKVIASVLAGAHKVLSVTEGSITFWSRSRDFPELDAILSVPQSFSDYGFEEWSPAFMLPTRIVAGVGIPVKDWEFEPLFSVERSRIGRIGNFSVAADGNSEEGISSVIHVKRGGMVDGNDPTGMGSLPIIANMLELKGCASVRVDPGGEMDGVDLYLGGTGSVIAVGAGGHLSLGMNGVECWGSAINCSHSALVSVNYGVSASDYDVGIWCDNAGRVMAPNAIILSTRMVDAQLRSLGIIMTAGNPSGYYNTSPAPGVPASDGAAVYVTSM